MVFPFGTVILITGVLYDNCVCYPVIGASSRDAAPFWGSAPHSILRLLRASITFPVITSNGLAVLTWTTRPTGALLMSRTEARSLTHESANVFFVIAKKLDQCHGNRLAFPRAHVRVARRRVCKTHPFFPLNKLSNVGCSQRGP